MSTAQKQNKETKVVRPSLSETAVILTDLVERLNVFERFGAALVNRYRDSTTTRVCLASLLPLLKELYPEITFFEEKATHGNP